MSPGSGRFIDLGAQWIHGEKGSPVFEIAQEHGICEDPKNGTLEDLGLDFYDQNGKYLAEKVN